MNLGTFSISLAFKDFTVSQAFYEKLGFEQVGGDPTQNWLILRNGNTTNGVFQGMFERNRLTFNRGWTARAETLKEFDDVREIQRTLKANGLQLTAVADESSTRPASVMLVDPDGNLILMSRIN